MSNLTIKDKIKEVTEDFDAWCLCGSRECQRSVNYQQALKAIESAITEAYKKGYTDKGIEELMKHENNKGNQI